MPIRREDRPLYRGRAWAASRAAALKAARNRCESCKRPNHTIIYSYTWKTIDPAFNALPAVPHMMWIAEGSTVWRSEDGRPCSPVGAKALPRGVWMKLHVAHVDHNPRNMSPFNLRVFCPWCHFQHDLGQHKDTRCDRKDSARPVLQEAS